MSGETYGTFLVVSFLVMTALYFLPTYLAFRCRHPNRFLILAVNLFFGATGIGWLASLIWALNVVHLPGEPGQSRGGQSGLNLFVNDPKTVTLQLASPAAAASPLGRLSVAVAVERIEALDRLRSGDHLSEAEYARLKAEVLAALA